MLSGLSIIVTGGANGIGKQTCSSMFREGAHVVCGDINENDLNKFQKEFELEEELNCCSEPHKKGSISFHKFDASSSDSCKKLVDFTFEKFKKIDVLFNNVGIQPKESGVPIHLLDDSIWDLVLTVNLKSTFWLCKNVIPHMISQGKGSIINNASIQGIQSQMGAPVYAASKGGLLSLTRQLSCEYGRNNIRVNSISPGCICTNLMLENNSDLSYPLNNTPLSRLGSVDDVANCVIFLASDKSSWITGQNIVVDGGMTSKGGWAPITNQVLLSRSDN